MALTKDQWTEVSDMMAKLRAMGCAVCVFTPDDIESAHDEAADDEDQGIETAAGLIMEGGLSNEQVAALDEDGDAAEKIGMTAEESADWMDRNRKYLEDTLSTAGNLYIADNLGEDD